MRTDYLLHGARVIDPASGIDEIRDLYICGARLADPDMGDLTVSTFHNSPHVRSLPHVMSKYLSLGLSLPEVLRRGTEIPAKFLGLEGEIGTLRPGARADIAVFKLEDRIWEQEDFCGEKIRCEQLLVPQMTFLDGSPV